VEAEGNVLLASVENMQYAVSVDVLHTVSRSGKLLPECSP
jgi:polypyrimidine tract-binding protein 2